MSVKEKSVRNLTKTLAMLSLLTPVVGYPLGIGDIKLHSALNQNLNAEIPLTLSADENAADIKVGLAPAAKFDEAGVPWTYFLSKIKFQTVTKSNGSVVIKLSSKEALKEPFLNLLVEVSWPKGNLYREFTVLVDPPSNYQTPPPTVEPVTPTKQPVSTTKPVLPVVTPPVNKIPDAVVTKPITTPPVLPSSNVSTPVATTPSEVNNASTYTVHRKETMWSIGVKFSKDKGVSVEQMLMAIYQANPDTFERNNLFGLQTGTVLNIPDVSAAQKLTADEAKQAYEAQKKAWRSGATLPGPSVVPVATATAIVPTVATPTTTSAITEKTPITQTSSGNSQLSFKDDQTNKKLPVETPVKTKTDVSATKLSEIKPQVAPLAPLTTTPTVAPPANVTQAPEVVKETNENSALTEKVAQLEKQLKVTKTELVKTKKEIAEIKKSTETTTTSINSKTQLVSPDHEVLETSPKPLKEIDSAVSLGTVNPSDPLQPMDQPTTIPEIARPAVPDGGEPPVKKILVSVDKAVSLTMAKPVTSIVPNVTVPSLAEIIPGTKPQFELPKNEPPKNEPLETESEPSILDAPFLLTLGGASALLVFGLGALWWRKRKQAIEESWYEKQPSFKTGKTEVAIETDNDITSLITEPAKFEGPSIFDDGSWAIDIEEQTEIDPISEADVYLAVFLFG